MEKVKKIVMIIVMTVALASAYPACSGQAAVERSMGNIETFVRLYGYVKYFYPGDEAAETDWDKFAVYGVKRVETALNKSQLKKILEELFLPIAPALVIHNSGGNVEFSAADITPPGTKEMKEGYKVTAWQHMGLGFGKLHSAYRSIRLNRDNKPIIIKDPLFEAAPGFGEYIAKELGSGLSCVMPIALYIVEDRTCPQSSPGDVARLRAALEKEVPKEFSGGDLYVRLGDIVIAWNIFRHFSPYSDVVKTDWNACLLDALKSAFNDKNQEDFLMTLKKLVAGLKDGHGRVYLRGDTSGSYFPGASWDWIEGKLVITGVFDESLTGIRAGDVVAQINGEKAGEALKNNARYISAAGEGWLRYRNCTELLTGPENSEMILEIIRDGKAHQTAIRRSWKIMDYYKRGKNSVPYELLEEGIHYLNLDVVTMKEIKQRMPELEKAKAIICDLRGYPNGNHNLIAHLLKEKENDLWMQIPCIIYPDYENVTYKRIGWNMAPQEPHLGAKIVFITDGRAISYAESFMGYIEHYGLATIVGQPTAGTNGNVNPFTLPGGYRVTWTGMRVVKHDGSQHHGVGIIPHVRVERTVTGVKEGRDEFLEKAIEIAKNQGRQ